ncbi:MAG: hypothetical protein II932_07605, partial [Treponema sp.]|nr:hypothetical protein [Treponema sp.]
MGVSIKKMHRFPLYCRTGTRQYGGSYRLPVSGLREPCSGHRRLLSTSFNSPLRHTPQEGFEAAYLNKNKV